MQNIKVMFTSLITISSMLFNYSNINVKSEVIKNITVAKATVYNYRINCYYDINGLVGNNPQGLFEHSGANYKIDYYYKGTWWTPTWSQVHYYFDGCYSFLLYTIILNNDLFRTAIREWVDGKKELSNAVKRAVLEDLFLGYLKIGVGAINTPSFNWYREQDFNKFVTGFINYFDFNENSNENYIIQSSLYNTFKSWNKSRNAQWLSRAMNESDFSIDTAYDGGINYMVYYNYRNHEAFARNLASASYQSSSTKEGIGKLFNKTKHFISERTSGGLNYLSYVRYDNINNVYRKVYY